MAGAAASAAALRLAGKAAAAPVETRKSRLWYRQPAREWVEALPVGNGRLGAMIFGGIDEERLQLNEDTLWTGGPYDPVNPQALNALPEVRRLVEQDRFAEAEAMADDKLIGVPRTQMAYQSFGDLRLSFPGVSGEVSDYERELDLDSALARVSFSRDGRTYSREVFASPVDDVVAMRIAGECPFDLDIALASEQPEARVEAAERSLLLTGHNAGRAGIDGVLRLAGRVSVDSDGKIAQSGGRLNVRGARQVTLLLAMATSFRRFDDTGADPVALVDQAIERAAAKDYETLRGDAIAAHRRLFRRVSLDLGTTPAAELPTDARIAAENLQADPDLARLYFDYGRYLLIASSRPGTQPANLQGIWNAENEPPWESKYTVNINTEMNYWPAEVTGLQECVEPLVQMVRELAVTGAHTARTMYGARGWVCHHYTDLWRATAPIDGAQWGMWPLGGAWLCTHLWDHYDYSRDTDFLTSVYPVMRGAALFFLDTLQTDPATGYLVTNPSISPENRHPEGAAVTSGPAMDQQILRDLFRQTASAAAILGTDPDFAADIMQARSRLAPDRIGAQGQLQEWREDWDSRAPEPDHRHVSHLYALFPGSQIDPATTPDLANAARRSLELRGDESTGWATAWRINLRARLREGDRAHDVLAFLLGPGRTYPNMFDAHPPFQIDGNFGGTRAIAEMLMQSHNGTILLLPALPAAWREGSVKGLRARGGCRVDLDWRDGRMASAVLTADADGSWRVGLPGRLMEVTLAKGQTLRFGEEDLPPAP
ncbi:MAG: hypothetical protein CL820_09750 [Croceicoccus sp.]|mgnify:CR=1 FL=1|nr:hypothetical protein [Croceicoccus sp.]MAL26157.1 hypothetical protein [Croceicoccus sp.]